MDTSLVQTVKLLIVNGTGLAKDALHIFFGLAAFFLVCILFRKPVSHFLPLSAAISIALLGEAVDMFDNISSFGYWRWQASVHDIFNTAFWPTVIFVLARYGLIFGKGGRP